MCGWSSTLSSDPLLPTPVCDFHFIKIYLVFHSFPKDSTVARVGNIREYGIFKHSFHGYWVAASAGTRGHAKESIFRINRAQHAIIIKSHPRYVVPNTFHFVSWQGGCHHCQVCLSTCRRKRCSYVALFSFWICNTNNLEEDNWLRFA